MENGNTLDYLKKIMSERFGTDSHRTFGEIVRIDPESLRIDPDLLIQLLNNRHKILACLEERQNEEKLLDHFMLIARRHLNAHNQYLNLSADETVTLKELFRMFLSDCKATLPTAGAIEVFERRIRSVVTEFLCRIHSFISEYLEKSPLWSHSGSDSCTSRFAGEYSPEKQCRILSIDPQELPIPVLDVGCGNEGLLVKYLRNLGIEAYGIDRIAAGNAGLFNSDWFEFRFEKRYWGTVISHMSFSNHFLFHHLHPHGRPEIYAKRYMDILESLKHGGSFRYAPGLPFIERFLPDADYARYKREIDFQMGADSELLRNLKENIWYSMQIKKV